MSYRVIQASELVEYLYCRRAWWLRRLAGHASRNSRQLAAGRDYHRQHGQQVARSFYLQRAALLLVLLALAIIFAWAAWG